MPDNRFIHPKLGHSVKVGALTDFEYRVWTTYLLASDDCGVMRASATSLQNASQSLEQRPQAEVQAAFENIIASGLLQVFEHQGRRYVYQWDWQDWQNVRHPRASIHPDPPELARLSKATRELFRLRAEMKSTKKAQNSDQDNSGSVSDPIRDDSGKVSEMFPSLARAGGCERLTANGKPLTANGEEAEPPKKHNGPGGRSDGVLAGALPRNHLHCADCSPNFAWCVPSAVHAKFKNALLPKFLGDVNAVDAGLRDWYRTVWDGLPPGFTMGDAFKLWQVKFDAKWADKPEPQKPSEEDTLAAMRAEIDRQNAMVRRHA